MMAVELALKKTGLCKRILLLSIYLFVYMHSTIIYCADYE